MTTALPVTPAPWLDCTRTDSLFMDRPLGDCPASGDIRHDNGKELVVVAHLTRCRRADARALAKAGDMFFLLERLVRWHKTRTAEINSKLVEEELFATAEALLGEILGDAPEGETNA